MDEATANIADIIANTVRVTAGEIKPGDYVFTTTGERIRVAKVRELARGRVKITRVDGWTDYLKATLPITIQRG